MGCGLSKEAVSFQQQNEHAKHRPREGSTNSIVKLARAGSTTGTGMEEKRKTQWKLMSTRDQIIKETDTPLNEDEIELRVILADPVGQKYIGNFAKEILTSESFFCWVEIIEFCTVPSPGFRKCMAKHIYDKYIRVNANMALGGLNHELVQEFEAQLAAAKKDPKLLNENLFDKIQRLCLNDMCQNTFKLFKKSPQYEEYRNEIKTTYNLVTVDDFDYMQLIGSGGFGRVVHAVKKSTRKHYAMKIQLKTGLLDEHRGDLSKLACEKVIFQSCSNPYITGMHYSFQTEKYAIIVLELVRGGDLHKALKDEPGHGIDEERMILYAAETALALNHLHDMGLLYRDLKPANILLTEDGHVKLADMGLVGGLHLGDPNKLKERDEELNHEDEEIERRKHRMSQSEIVFEAPTLEPESDKFHRAPTAMNIRRKTTVGTRGYMAPELLRGKLMPRSQRPGYNHSVDYWALGITTFELMCGYQPFSMMKIGRAGDGGLFGDFEMKSPRQELEEELDRLHEKIDYPRFLSDDAVDFISRLLDPDEKTRMGCTERGFSEVMDHPFLKSIDWDKLLVRHVKAKYFPACKSLDAKPIFSSFADMMAKFDDKDRSGDDWHEAPTPEMQKYFESWDFVSPNTLKAELGIANEMEVSNLPYKVIQLTGETGN